MEKIYQQKNVYEALQDRLGYIFSEFDNIYVAFSGGKDSGLLYNLVLRYMDEHGLSRKIGLFHQDFEAQFTKTTEYVERVFSSAPSFVDRYWCCLPMGARNAMDQADPWWYPWDDKYKDIWVRPMPDHDYVVNLDNNILDYYEYKMPQDDMYARFGRWYKNSHGGGKTVGLIGVRADESLHRYNSVVNKRHPYKDKKWITGNQKDVWSASPLYDWTVEDVWTANGKFGFDYNRLYDLYYKAGVPMSQMRVASPFNDWAGPALNLYRIIEPEMWSKMIGRVNGANFGAIYGATKAMGYKEVTLPEGHTWQSYAIFLLSTLPKDIRDNYVRKFKLSLDDTEDVTGTNDMPSWKKMCCCILKNDYSCRSMGSGPTKEQKEAVKRKYAAIIHGKEK